MRAAAVPAALLATILSAACGDDGAPAEDGAGSDATGSGGAGGAEAHDYVEVARRSGIVTIYEAWVESSRQTGVVGAFLDIVDGDPGSCADEIVAGCTATFCRSGSVPREALVDAGILSIDVGVGVRSLARNDVTGFYLDQMTGDVLQPGSPILVAASGARVGAFDVALVSPAELTVTSALPVSGSVLPTDAPFTITWSAEGDEGVAQVAVRADPGRERVSLVCEVPIEAGAATIPPEALAIFRGISHVETASITLETRSEVEVDAGGFPVSIAVVVTAFAEHADATRYLGGFAP